PLTVTARRWSRCARRQRTARRCPDRYRVRLRSPARLEPSTPRFDPDVSGPISPTLILRYPLALEPDLSVHPTGEKVGEPVRIVPKWIVAAHMAAPALRPQGGGFHNDFRDVQQVAVLAREREVERLGDRKVACEAIALVADELPRARERRGILLDHQALPHHPL